MKVAISFVSTSDAQQNLQAEDPGWSLQRVATAAQTRWNALLGRIRIGGGTAAQQHTFYTALYHSLLFPNVVSDVNGDYAGSDGKVHTAHGRQEYANFSEWDIYRSEIQLESLLAPKDVGDMVQSLVDDAAQGGWLPKWAIVGGDESQMNGDSGGSHHRRCLRHGRAKLRRGCSAQGDGQGGDTERDRSRAGDRASVPRPVPEPALRQRGPVGPHVHRLFDRGSATLEYAIDDFSIVKIAQAQHDNAVASAMQRRAANWGIPVQSGYWLHPGPGQRRQLPARPGLRGVPARTRRPDGIERGQRGAVHVVGPAGPGRARSIGGDAAATGELQTFFTSLNATRAAPTTGRATNPASGRPGYSITSAHPTRRSASCEPS